MSNINILKTNNKNLPLFLTLGIAFFLLAIVDFCLNNFLNINITSFLPRYINFFTPLIFGVIGLHLIRIEFSGIKILDNLNKNINTINFNAVLSLSIILLIIFALPSLLNWFIFDANISGDTKEACTGGGACWVYIKVWFNRFMYGMYPNPEQWRINVTFIAVLAFTAAGFFVPAKFRNYLSLYYTILLPIISFILIYYLVSGGSFGLEWVETGAWGWFIFNLYGVFFLFNFLFPFRNDASSW